MMSFLFCKRRVVNSCAKSDRNLDVMSALQGTCSSTCGANFTMLLCLKQAEG